MNHKTPARVGAFFAVLGAYVTCSLGCSSDPVDKTATTSDELRNCAEGQCPPPILIVKPVPTYSPPRNIPLSPPPPPGPVPGGTCTAVDPLCTMIAGTYGAFAVEVQLAASGQCAAPFFWQSAPATDPTYETGWLALCNDTPAVRAAAASGGEHSGVASSPCDACVGAAQSGQIYVVWERPPWFRPTCGSGCSKLPWT